MRTKRPAPAWVIALALLVASSRIVIAQLAGEQESRVREALGDDSILRVAPVLDAPFSADVLTAWHPKPNSGRSEWHATSRYYRDRAGRVRVEQMFVGHTGAWHPQRIIVVADPPGAIPAGPSHMSLFLLDPVARSVTKISRGYARGTAGGPSSVTMPVSTTCFISFIRPHRMNPTLERNGQTTLVIGEEPLGEQTLAGVQVTGTRYTTTIPAGIWNRRQDVHMTYERWVSSELKLEVHNRSEDSRGEVIERRLTNIRRVEPRAELFQLPQDYRTARMLDTLWLNPDVPEIWPAGASPAERCAKPWP